MILTGDVGGTKVALALVEEREGSLRILREERYPTEDFDGLAPVVDAFLADVPERPDRACFGIAAPVVDDSPAMTNLDWELDRRRLADAIGIPNVDFLNDLAAAAYGIDALPPGSMAVLRAGDPRGPTAGLVAAGTGLGMAILTEVDGRTLALPTEAGHQGFAPRTSLEDDLLAWLRGRFPDRVSAERVVSGAGIEAIYDFLLESGREAEPSWLAERLARSADRSEAISETALAGEAAICEAATEIFVRCYGAAAGDFALATLALRAIYLGGGIAPAILPFLRHRGFLEAFGAEGRLGGLLEEVPVLVIRDLQAPLLGAARWALAGRDRVVRP
jgi:glucokinase